MSLNLDKQKLEELMKDFHILTGIRIAIFDSDYREILSYPPVHCPFCGLMQGNAPTYEECMESNRKSFLTCKKSGQLMIYHCHAGLVEASAPLIDNGVIIGYLMFGQISDIEDASERVRTIRRLYRANGAAVKISDEDIRIITYKSQEQIQAAAKILEACTFYVLLKEMICLEKQRFISKLDGYIDRHISEDISVNSICRELGIGRSRLYEVSAQYLGIGIAEYIKQKRIAKARELLSNAGDPVSLIAQKVGFADYNYFCRVFKLETGMPAKLYRKRHQ